MRIVRAKKGEQKAKLNLRKCGITDDIVRYISARAKILCSKVPEFLFLNAQLIELMAAMSTYPVVMKLELEQNAISTKV